MTGKRRVLPRHAVREAGEIVVTGARQSSMSSPPGPLRAELKNISASGVGLQVQQTGRTPSSLAPDAPVLIRVQLRGQELLIPARTVWSKDTSSGEPNLGVRMVLEIMDAASRQTLLTWIQELDANN